MAMTFISRATLPVVGKGKAGGPRVNISDKGQVTLSTQCAAVMQNVDGLAVAYDKASRLVSLLAGTPATIKAAGGVGNLVPIKSNKKSKAMFFSAAAYFAEGGPFSDYSYKTSGNQGFNAEVDEKGKTVSFTLPKGQLTPKPKQERKPRTKKVKATVEAPATPVAEGEEDLLTPA
jgi:hypothetical protein